MAGFYGTIEDFDRFLMPRIRNRVQTLARPLKERANGACEHCGRTGVTLEAAHVHGRDRKTIVREVLEKYRTAEGYHIGNLNAFEQEVVDAHEPIDEAFLFLCKECHRAYDAQPNTAVDAQANSPTSVSGPSGETAKQSGSYSNSRYRRDDVLPISLIPENQDAFKEAFLASGKAEIREYYADGSQKTKAWNRRMSSGFSKTSNVIGNLRSRGEYRSGTWQESGLVRIEVEVRP